MVSAFLFDIGNVIIHFDFSKAARRLAPFCTVGPETALERVASLTDPLERGELSVEEFVSEASKRIGFSGSSTQFLEAFEDIFELNQPVVDWIGVLEERGYPLHLLSNTNAIHVPFFESTYPVFEAFTGRIYSHEVGVMKPDPEIYQKAIEKLELDPATTIYLDDRPENIIGGNEAGLQSILYEVSRHDEILRKTEQFIIGGEPSFESF